VNEHGFTIFGHAEIAVRAHSLWEARGCPAGTQEEDWRDAVSQLRTHPVRT
jgi:hypothetical protein